MENGRYRLKEGNGEVEIVVVDDKVTCVLSKNNPFWVVGEECDKEDIVQNCWELISDKQGNTSSFRVGDKVKIKDGTPFSNGKLVATVAEVSCDRGDVKVWLEETYSYMFSENLSLYNRTPHKYADVIKAWADGYEVQYYSKCNEAWEDQDYPSFNPDLEWRVKPENPNQDRISEIEKTIEHLQNELQELKKPC